MNYSLLDDLLYRLPCIFRVKSSIYRCKAKVVPSGLILNEKPLVLNPFLLPKANVFYRLKF